MSIDTNKTIKIAGAGISGMTAAIVLAKAGRNVEIYEKADMSGKRFQGDFQGIENWTRKEDVLDFMRKIGLEINFNYKAVDNFILMGPENTRATINSKKPILYLVKRGAEEGSLDRGIELQIKNHHNIKIFYNSPITDLQSVDIVATGPVFNSLDIDAFAAGYTFNTEAADQAVLILNDELAKDGYSYFVVFNGSGVIISCFFYSRKNMNRLADYKEKTLKFCQENFSFSMQNVKNFSGTGNVFLSKNKSNRKIYIGEAGGYQDFLFGFGMRTAMITGFLAAKSILEKEDFYKLVAKEINPYLKASISSRFLYSMLGNTSYKILIKRFINKADPAETLAVFYGPSLLKKVIYPFARLYYFKYLRDPRKTL